MTPTTPFFTYSTTPQTALPSWLTDEAALADEAALFGLSEARPDDRIAQIRLAFAERTALLEKEIEQAHERLSDLNLAIHTAETSLNGGQPKVVLPVPTPSLPAATWRMLAGLTSVIIGSVGVFFGIDRALSSPILSGLTAGLVGISGCAAVLMGYWFAQKKDLVEQQFRQQVYLAQQTADRAYLAEQLDHKQQSINALYLAEAARNQQFAHRDRLIRLFESEFDLARSIRYSLQPDQVYQ